MGHKEADDEVAGLKGRYEKVKAVSDEWMKKVDTLVKEWKLLDNTVTELNSWVAKDRGADGIHPRRTQEHLQRKGKVGGKLVIFLNYAFPFYKFFQKKTISSSYILLLKCWFLHIYFSISSL